MNRFPARNLALLDSSDFLEDPEVYEEIPHIPDVFRNSLPKSYVKIKVRDSFESQTSGVMPLQDN